MAWQRKHGKKKSDAWFVGSTTVLRNHVRRYMPYPSTPSASGPCPLDAHRFADTHYEPYAKRCAELGIRPHPRTQQGKVPDEGKEYARLVVYLEWLLTDLLGCFSSTAQGPVQWSREVVLDHIMRHIVECDLVSCAARPTILDRVTSKSSCLVSATQYC